ncbi:hypothetical protein M434DRAFT_35023 [Hypoxylon sp. CO27-5]|nr:hypothetical protein M434DRAFT_35023 [Hypoxylon sp. CO27-5]
MYAYPPCFLRLLAWELTSGFNSTILTTYLVTARPRGTCESITLNTSNSHIPPKLIYVQPVWSLQWCYNAPKAASAETINPQLSPTIPRNLVRVKEAQQTQSQSDTVTGSEAAATGRNGGGPFAEAKGRHGDYGPGRWGLELKRNGGM